MDVFCISLIYCQVPAIFKAGLSPSKKSCVICSSQSPLKTMKNATHFIFKALFALKIFYFLSRLFGRVGKTASLER